MDYKNGAGDGNKRFLFYYRGQSALCVHHNNNLKKIYWSACSFKETVPASAMKAFFSDFRTQPV